MPSLSPVHRAVVRGLVSILLSEVRAVCCIRIADRSIVSLDGLSLLKRSMEMRTGVSLLVPVTRGIQCYLQIQSMMHFLIAICRAAPCLRARVDAWISDLLLRRETESPQLILQILQLRVELLLFSVEILENVVDLATVTTHAHLPATRLLELPDALLVSVRVRVERVVVADHVR